MQAKYTYIDLFSGAGGFSLGFRQKGFQNIFSIDYEVNPCRTYQSNFPNHVLVEKNICELTNTEIQDLQKKRQVDVVIGGPPCQGFSLAGNIGRKFTDDPRNKLFWEFVRVVKIVKPRFLILENVARIYTHNKGKTKTEIIDAFEALGYTVECEILNSADYGVPQIRKRAIFIGTKFPQKILFPKPSIKRHKTVKEALDYYPRLEAGTASILANHVAMSHSAQMLKKMSYIGDGGNRKQIPIHLRPKTGDSRKYIKYASNKPSVCVTGDMRKIFHYDQNRALTVRELAKLQSFPDSFVFKGSRISQQQQVGNAVPQKMANALAKTIITMSNKNRGVATIATESAVDIV